MSLTTAALPVPPDAASEGGRVVAALQQAHAALDTMAVRDATGEQAGWVALGALTPAELGQAVGLLARLEGRISGLRVHAVHAAEEAEAAESTGSTDVSAWAASAAGRNRSRSWGGIWLGRLLAERYHHVQAALATGRISEEHAAVIVKVAETVPDGVDADDLARCEDLLVGKATRMDPRRLRRAARRLLDPLGKDLADRHEGELLEAEERRARRETGLVLSDNGDGTWTGRFTLPELHASALRQVLDRLSAPRRTQPGEEGQRLSLPERLGAAFCELIEHLPAERLGSSAFSVVVHLDEEQLRSGLGAAQLDTGVRISAGEARRLACGAGLLPMVLGGRSVPLDLGHGRRLFSRAQSIALSALHETCAAQGCDRPFAWCELHHRHPWSQGGPTDLENALPLCGHHHRRIHDTEYEHHLTAEGEVVFTSRWHRRRALVA